MDRVFAQSEVGKLGFDEQGRLAWADQVVATTAEVLRNNLLATRPEEGEDLHVIERRVRTVLRAAGEVLMEACANRAADALPRPVCCGHPMHRAHRRARAVQGAVGDWMVMRLSTCATTAAAAVCPRTNGWESAVVSTRL